MNLKDIKRPYDVVVSLGSWCGVAQELKQHHLRRFSGPFDWVTSPSLSDINRLLKNNFEGFMDIKNMNFIKKSKFIVNNEGDQEVVTEKETYVIQDTKYNIASWHDFPVIPNQRWEQSYPSYKVKLNRRINRFLELINRSEMTLFVRYSASFNEVAELESILMGLTKGKFQILLVNPMEGLQLVKEENWNLGKTVCMSIPFVHSDETQWNSHDWDFILNGITVKS